MVVFVFQAVEEAFVPVIKMTYDGIEVSSNSALLAFHVAIVLLGLPWWFFGWILHNVYDKVVM